jgi:group II intron reverse transcriptase/maturase
MAGTRLIDFMKKPIADRPPARGSDVQATRVREGEAGHNVSLDGTTGETPNSPTVSTTLQRIAEQAVRYPETAFTTLAHLIDQDLLREAHRRTRKSGAPGCDGVTAADYAVDLDANLRDLHERLRSGRYRAPPVERAWLPKDDGSQRPIGKPTFEDKIVQRAVSMLLEQIYEQDFYDFSHGFRPRRSPHQALHELRERCWTMNVHWLVDADVTGFFDNIDKTLLQEFIRRRVNDGGIRRLIGKWLNAGVLEGEDLTYSEKGTPQGGVISPLLANIFLHYVLDDWFVREVQPRMRGRAFLIRFADDFVIGCELEEDARRLMEVLPKRFAKHGLTIHPKKTKLIEFGRPRKQAAPQAKAGGKPNEPSGSKPGGGPGRGNGTFDFLGFTHYWGRSRKGNWVIKKRTSRKRIRRTKKSFWQWCREHRHMPIVEQHKKLCQKLRGFFQYAGVRFNYKAMESVLEDVKCTWKFWLSRRSHKGAIDWEKFQKLLKRFPLPKPRIIHQV